MSAGFVVVPDTTAGAELQALVPFTNAQVTRHPSGRPWLVGEWSSNELRTALAGSTRLALVGHSPMTTTQWERLAARVSRLSDVEQIVPSVPGSCFLVASVDGQVRFQGSVSGLRRVFHTRVDGVTVAANRSDVLAAMTGAGVDDETLALRVACGLQVPYPANARSTWSGVRSLAPENALLWNRDHAREVVWWRPSTPDQSLREGATDVRNTLRAVLDQTPPPEGRLSADLSGGLDSTSLCFLAARRTPELLTFRWGEAEAGNDDARYADHAGKLLDRAEHVVVPQHELPEIFADPGSSCVSTEEPVSLTRAVARMRHNARLLASHGARRHLAGHGGDELFAPLPTYLHQLLRRHPVTALTQVRAYCALRRWPLAATLAELSNTNTFASWWRAEAGRLTDPAPPRRRPTLGWGFGSLRAAPWMTRQGVDLAREALLHTAEQAHPLADDLGTHTLLLLVRSNTASYRLLTQLYAESGVALDMPFLDDAVLQAVLRVPAHERGGPWRYKPLLGDAMQGIVPDQIRARSTKGEFGEDIRRGLRCNLPAILELFADSELADRGLIDPDVLRAQLARPQPDNSTVQALENLLGCETWLRTATARGATPTTRPDDRPLDPLEV